MGIPFFVLRGVFSTLFSLLVRVDDTMNFKFSLYGLGCQEINADGE